MEKFVDYCKQYILDHIEDWEGQSHYGCDWGDYLTEGPNCDGSLTYSSAAARDYLKEWWEDAAEYWDYEKFNFGEHMHNPFDNPEAYMVCMVIEGVRGILGKIPCIEKHWNDQMEMTKRRIKEIKKFVEEFNEDSLF